MHRAVTVALALASALALADCTIWHGSSGEPSAGIANPAAAAAYIALETHNMGIVERWGAALVVAPHIAATSAHNGQLVPPKAIIGVSRDYDLMFFRTDKSTVPPFAAPQSGEHVIAYGQGKEEDQRQAAGVVRALDAKVAPECDDCPEQKAVAYDAEAGKGFSGGPVVDAETGAVVALTFGYRDGEAEGGGRRMFAYDINLVLDEMRRLTAAAGAPP